MTTEEPSDEQTGPGPVDEGIQHLEAAAKELISAGRSFLDAVEGAIGGSGLDQLFTSLVDRGGDRAGARDPGESAETAEPDPPSDTFREIPIDGTDAEDD